MGWYSRAVAKVPYVFIVVDLVLAFVAGPLTAYFHGVPDFSDPLQGFDPRGTEIRGWMNAVFFTFENMHAGTFLLAPGDPGIKFNNSGVDHLNLAGGGVLGYVDNTIITDLDRPDEIPRLGVVSMKEDANLFSREMLVAICDLQKKAIKEKCRNRCDVISLPDVIAQLRETTCEHLSETDIIYVQTLLGHCIQFYINGALKRECSETNNCEVVDPKCQVGGLIFKIFNDYTDKKYMEDGDFNKLQLSYSMIYLLWYEDAFALRKFYTDEIGENLVHNDHVKLYGIQLTIDRVTVEYYIIQDMIWYGLAMAVVILLLVIYLRSFILMLTVTLNVVFSLSIAYWFYFMVFRFTFFPFINTLAGLLLIALGADDLFIFYDIWRDEKILRPKASYEELVSIILHKGGTSVFVTSFTTAAALLANFVNDVIAIRCFGAFAAICVFVNFFLFITWVPAIIVVIDFAYTSCLGDDFCQDKSTRMCRCLFNTHDWVWKKFMPKMVIKAAPFWIILILLIATGSLVATFYKPRLKLPASNNFQPLVLEHPFQVYTSELKQHLRFEKKDEFPVNVQFIWGVKGIDNGNLLDPDIIGHFVPDDTFDIYTEDSQIWLYDLCKDLLRNNTFVDSKFAAKAKCYWKIYKDYIVRPCSAFGPSRCCAQTFPTQPAMTKTCMGELAHMMHGSTKKEEEALIGLPLFDKDGKVVTFQMFFETKYIWTGNYDAMHMLYQMLQSYLESHLETAPAEVANGWFSGAYANEFRFFDLQQSLASGTLSGIAVSIAIGFVVLLITTQNIFLTFYAIMTISLVLSTTAGILALMGWELNISEALILTLSMGLSIDFTIHNGIAYKLAEFKTREEKVKDTLSSVGSAITMAALTTFGAGASMISASVWAYRQFGIFLVLTMIFSWFYANFFFLSLLATIGPTGRTGDFSCCFTWIKNRLTKRHKREQRRANALPHAHSSVYLNGDASSRHGEGMSKKRPPPPPPPVDDCDEPGSLSYLEDTVVYTNNASTDAPEIPSRDPLNKAQYQERQHRPANSEHDFKHKHLKKHRRRTRDDQQPHTSSSSSSSNFPNFYTSQEGEGSRFNPPVRNHHRKDYFQDSDKKNGRY